jgi:hypothetical protein
MDRHGVALCGRYMATFGVILVLVFAWFFVAWLYGRNSGGKVLVDCGPHPTRKLFLLNAVIFLVIGVSSGLAASSLSNVFAVGGPVFVITAACVGSRSVRIIGEVILRCFSKARDGSQVCSAGRCPLLQSPDPAPKG